MKPSVKDSQNCPKVRIPRGTYMIKVNTSVKKEPSTSDAEESQFAKASTMPLPSKMPPVYIIAAIQETISTRIGTTKSLTLPMPPTT